jgi:hypothetical protein
MRGIPPYESRAKRRQRRMDAKLRNCHEYSMHQRDSGQFLLRKVRCESEVTLRALVAELNAATDLAQEQRIRHRVDLCIDEINRTSIAI